MRRHLSFLFLLLAAGSAAKAQPTAVPAAPGTSVVKLTGLRETVTVRRDNRGVPHIEAANEADLYFAQGYATASDRLWQMDLFRRRARGELAEIFGRRALEADQYYRRFGFAQVVEQHAANTPPALRAVLEAYTRGVNAYLASLDEKTLPVEFRILRYQPRPWTPTDTLLVGKLFADDLSTTWRSDLMRAALGDLPAAKRGELLPESSPLDLIIVGSDQIKEVAPKAPPARRTATSRVEVSRDLLPLLTAQAAAIQDALQQAGFFSTGREASNNWVVSGTRTASGKPLLANDPHLAPTVPSIWYLVHLSAPGLNVAGVVAPGIPGVIIGHNDRIAWGVTNLGPDVQDLYRERFDPQNPRRYQTPTGWRDAEIRREEIKVRKQALNPETESVMMEVIVTRHGPIIFEKAGERYALRWTALDPRRPEFAAFYSLNRARNWNEFRAALKSYPGPTQNFVYADVDGHIGYYGAGDIPIRRSGDGSVPYDGATDDGEWTGFIPFEQLPHVYDPPSGLIVTANQRIVGHDYPYFISHEWAAPYRARRIYTLLNQKPKLTADDFRQIQGDVYSIPGVTFKQELLKLAQTKFADDPQWNDLPRWLEKWDGRVAGDSREAILVGEIREVFSSRLLAATVGAARAKEVFWFNLGTLLDRVMVEQPREWLPPEFKSYAEFLRACYQEARANLVKRLGADETKWTYANPASRPRWWNHPLDSAPLIGAQFKIPFFATGGNSTTPNVAAFVSMRLIANPGDWDQTRHGFALGQSGDPQSPHYKDQLDDWRGVTPPELPFTQAAVERATKLTLRLTP